MNNTPPRKCGLMIRLLPRLLIMATLLPAIAAGSDRYCGIMALYGACQALGVSADFESLISTEYVSSVNGSSLADLRKAAEHLGVHVTPLMHLGPLSLRSAADPLILHTALDGQLRYFNHWALFLGMEGDKGRIVEAAGQVTLMSIPDILARWDGVALAVHTDKTPKANYAGSEWSASALLLAAAVGVLACLHGWCERRPRAGNSRRLAGLLLGSLLITALSWLVMGTATIVRGHPARYIEAATGPAEFPEVDRGALMEALKHGKARIVDARYAPDFELGALPTAVNIPIDATMRELYDAVQDWEQGDTIVIYCQSEGCQFDRIVAIRLAGMGFTNVRVWPPGWVGWKQSASAVPTR